MVGEGGLRASGRLTKQRAGWREDFIVHGALMSLSVSKGQHHPSWETPRYLEMMGVGGGGGVCLCDKEKLKQGKRS